MKAQHKYTLKYFCRTSTISLIPRCEDPVTLQCAFYYVNGQPLFSCWNKLVCSAPKSALVQSLQCLTKEFKSLITVCVQQQSPGKMFLKVPFMHLCATKSKHTLVCHENLYHKHWFPQNSKCCLGGLCNGYIHGSNAIVNTVVQGLRDGHFWYCTLSLQYKTTFL